MVAFLPQCPAKVPICAERKRCSINKVKVRSSCGQGTGVVKVPLRDRRLNCLVGISIPLKMVNSTGIWSPSVYSVQPVVKAIFRGLLFCCLDRNVGL